MARDKASIDAASPGREMLASRAPLSKFIMGRIKRADFGMMSIDPSGDQARSRTEF